MKVLSFDVGIKNLAACVLEWNDEIQQNEQQNEQPNPINNLKIHYWTIINLLTSQSHSDEIVNNYKCCCKDSKRNDCDKKAKSFAEFNGIKYCFCTKHLSMKDVLLTNKLASYDISNWSEQKNLQCSECITSGGSGSCSGSKLVQTKSEAREVQEVQEIQEIQQIKTTDKKPDKKTDRKTYFVNNLLNCSLCSKHYKSIMSKVETAKTKVSPIKTKKVKDMTSDDLKFHLVKCLDERKQDLLNVDMVLIENQPTFKNPTMKAISDTLYTWFMIRGVVDKNLNNSTIQKIKFISPSNKLKEFDQKTIEDADETHKYKETKKLSIENTKTILASYSLNDNISRLLSFDKKDDLADSFLQGWYVLNSINNEQLYKEWQTLYNLIKVKTN